MHFLQICNLFDIFLHLLSIPDYVKVNNNFDIFFLNEPVTNLRLTSSQSNFLKFEFETSMYF